MMASQPKKLKQCNIVCESEVLMSNSITSRPNECQGDEDVHGSFDDRPVNATNQNLSSRKMARESSFVLLNEDGTERDTDTSEMLSTMQISASARPHRKKLLNPDLATSTSSFAGTESSLFAKDEARTVEGGGGSLSVDAIESDKLFEPSDPQQRTVYFLDVPVDLVDVLELHVENRKRGGGPYEVFQRDPVSGHVMVTFADLQVARNFRQLASLKIDNTMLSVVSSVAPKLEKDTNWETELCTADSVSDVSEKVFDDMVQQGPSVTPTVLQVMWSGPNQKITEDLLKLYLTNQKRSGGGTIVSIQFFAEECKALVTFSDPEAVQRLLARPRHQLLDYELSITVFVPPKPLKVKMESTVAAVASGASVTLQVMWSGQSITQSVLKLYLESRKRSGGGPVDNIRYFAEEQKAFVIFRDPEDAHRVIAHVPSHVLLGAELCLSIVNQGCSSSLDATGLYDGNDSAEYSCAIEVRDISTKASLDVVRMFFENRKRSGGDQIEDILYDGDEQRAVITFHSPDVVDRIVQKHSADSLHLCGCQLRIIPLRPRPERNLSPAACGDGNVDPARLLVSDLPYSVCTEDLERYFNRMSLYSRHEGGIVCPRIARVIYSMQPGVAMVEFSEQYDYAAIIRLTRLKPLKDTMISIEPVALTNSLQIRNFGDLAHDHLILYFEAIDSAEVDIVDIRMEDDFAVVRLSNSSAIPKLLSMEHTLESCRLEVMPYYECLGPLLSDLGSEPNWIPSDLVMTFDPKVVKFASSCSVLRSCLETKMATISPSCLIVWPDDVSGMDPAVVKVRFMRTTKPAVVKSCESQFGILMSGVEVEKVAVLQEVWKDFVERLEKEQMANAAATDEEVSLEIDKVNHIVHVIGLRIKCKKLVGILCDLKSKVETELQLAKSRVTEPFPICKPQQLALLRACGFMESQPGDAISIELHGDVVMLVGSVNDVTARKLKMLEMLAGSVISIARVEDFVLQLLKKAAFQKYIETCLHDKSLTGVVWEPMATNISILGVNSTQVDGAISVFRSAFLRKSIELDDAELASLKLPGWKDLKDTLATEYPTLELDENANDHSLTVTCSSNIVNIVLERLQNFLREHAIRDEFVSAANVGTVTAVERYLAAEVSAICSDFVSCAVSITKSAMGDVAGPGFIVRGTIHGQKLAGQRLRTLMAKVHHREKVFDQPGMAHYFVSTRGQKAVEAIERRYQAVVTEIKSEEVEWRGTSKANRGVDGVKLEVKIGKKFMVKIVMGDITKYKVDVIVNAANTSLDHAGGVARSIVDKGGSDIQTECNTHIRSKGLLRPTEYYISKPGRLPCKAVIHAVGPIWSNGQMNEKNLLFETVLNVLEAADKCGFKTIAMPAISTGIYQFPLSKASLAILEAVQVFCHRPEPVKAICEVHIIDQSTKVVRQFTETATAVFKKFPDSTVIHVVSNDDVVDISDHGVTSPPHLTKTMSVIPTVIPKFLPGVHTSRNRSAPDHVPSPSTTSPIVHGNILQTPEGIKVTLIKGSLVQQKVDIIVNTTRPDLNLSTGAISHLILQTAGPQIQMECQQVAPSGISFGGVIETSGYSLPCSKVYHGACEHWDNGAGGCEKTLRTFLREVLNRADMSGQVQSIAIPAIGTGNLKIPHALVARWMYDEVEQFSRKSVGTMLRDIRFVVYSRDTPTVSAFESELKNRTGGRPMIRGQSRNLRQQDGSGSPASGADEFHQISRIRGQWTIKLGSVTLSVKQGDIVRESTDAIVNSSCASLQLEKGTVSQAILAAAGPSIVEQCRRFVDMGMWSTMNVAVTSAGELPCRFIFHIAVERGIPEGMKACLQEAHEKRLSSITFPLLGTGKMGQKVSEMASIMLESVCKFIDHNKSTTLALIQIVIFDATMFDGFAAALSDKVKGNKSILSQLTRFLGISTGGDQKKFDVIETPRNVTEEEEEIETTHQHQLKHQKTIRLRISALSVNDLDHVVHDLDDLCTEVVHEHVIDATKYGETIAKLSDEHIAKIQSLDNDFPVKININVKSKEIRICGQLQSIMSVNDAIYGIFREVEDKEHQKVEAELISKQVQWMYQARESYEAYPPEINGIIEKAYQNKVPRAVWEENDGRYELDFIRMIEEKVGDPGNFVRVKRSGTDALQLPKTWDTMSASEPFKQILLSPSSTEYKDVENNVMLTANNTVHQIVSIARIQNPSLYQQYMVRYDSMQRTVQPATATNPLERILWHGTSADTLESINSTGFNRSYCGKNAVVYGSGVYFAQQFSYSAANTYAVPDINGHKHVYQSRVLTGEFTTGHQSYRVPPNKPGGPGAASRFDSVVDNMTTPSVFVIFSDTQAYPEYLIIFK